MHFKLQKKKANTKQNYVEDVYALQAFNLNVVKALNEINHLRPEPAPCPSAEFKSKTASWKTERVDHN